MEKRGICVLNIHPGRKVNHPHIKNLSEIFREGLFIFKSSIMTILEKLRARRICGSIQETVIHIIKPIKEYGVTGFTIVLKMLLIAIGLYSCKNGDNSGREDIIQSQEEKIKFLEGRLNKIETEKTSSFQQPTSNTMRSDNEPINSNPKVKEYFSIGSTEEEVLEIQGDPTSIQNIGSSKMFFYGLSYITFTNNKVDGYNNNANNLKIRASSNSTPQASKPVGKTKYIYFDCFITGVDFQHYYSKIYTISNYDEDKMYRIKNCLVERVKTHVLDSKITMLNNSFDSYSEASASWNTLSGEKIFGDEICEMEIFEPLLIK